MMTQSLVQTTRFGEVEYSPEDVVTFPEGIIGFPQCKSYLVLNHKEGSPFRWLQSVDNPGLAFLLVEPTHYVADYKPEVAPSALNSIEINEDSLMLVYTVVTIPKGNPEGMTLNLAGPLVINATNRLARQLVLEDPRWSLKHPAIPPDKSQADAA